MSPATTPPEVLAGKPVHHYEVRRRRKDGPIIQVLATVIPWRVDGQLVGVTGIGIEITERKRAEQATARLAAIVESSDDAIVGKTLDGQITSWNPAAERIYGYGPAEAIGNHISMLTPSGHRDEIGGLLHRVAAGERVTHFETTRRRKDGRSIDVSVTISPIRDREERIVGAATVTRDVTERKARERGWPVDRPHERVGRHHPSARPRNSRASARGDAGGAACRTVGVLVEGPPQRRGQLVGADARDLRARRGGRGAEQRGVSRLRASGRPRADQRCVRRRGPRHAGV